MNDPMSLESQRAHIKSRFRLLFNRPEAPVYVEFSDEEFIHVYFERTRGGIDPSQPFFLMTIGSDDDRYRFELWADGADTGIYIEFAFPGETL